MFRRSEPIFDHDELFFSTGVVTAPVVERPRPLPSAPEIVPVPEVPSETDGDPSSAMSSLERLSELVSRAEDIKRLLADDDRDQPGSWRATDSVSASEADSDSAITSSECPPAAWYDNPLGEGLRYWDGAHWTEHIACRRYDTAPPSETGSPTDSPGADNRGTELPGWWLSSDPDLTRTHR